MVDFDNEATIGTPAVDVVRILILQRRSDLIEALEDYNKKDSQGLQVDPSIIKARLMSFYLELQPALKRRYDTKNDGEEKSQYEKLKDLIKGKTKDDLIEAILFINEYLDNIRLTRIDTKNQYDSRRVEYEHKEKGL